MDKLLNIEKEAASSQAERFSHIGNPSALHSPKGYKEHSKGIIISWEKRVRRSISSFVEVSEFFKLLLYYLG